MHEGSSSRGRRNMEVEWRPTSPLTIPTILPAHVDEHEVEAEVQAVLEQLVYDGHLELSSRRSVSSLAEDLIHKLDPGVNLVDWLVDRDDVSELYLDEQELRLHLSPAFARLR